MDWFSRSDAENFALNVAFLKQYVKPLGSDHSLPLVFSHVPKTAGTSFESYLASQYKMSESLHINAPDLNRLPEIINIKKNCPRLICGHHPMHGMLYQLIPAEPLYHITLLRDPIDRVLSYYNYVCGKTDHPMHTSAMSLGFEDFLSQAPSPELHNGQTRRFAGQLHHTDNNQIDLLETATNVLNDCFSAVFTTGALNAAITTLHNDLGFENKPLPKANQSLKRIQRSDLSTNQIASITEHNQADIALFKRFS
ncbi:sulfotransferase family 2 domain-containing protein [Marinicella rhabdoformis]|uniref:sulfotransferase family 2 domain-containing protein n=1 Tax=Marinicella rhabdoformis TaxID=2580566 RepID=UPI0012AEC8F6|nr:sulfotransferase family 2 domain-containing protein [Marinicella rhabdoformis]